MRAPSDAAASGLLQTLKQIKEQSAVPLFPSEFDLVQFSDRLQQRNPNLTPSQLNAIISSEIDPILTYLTDKRGKNQFNNFAVYSGEDDLLVAVQYYVEQYAVPQNGTIIQSPTPSPPPSGANLQQTLRKIQQQSIVPVYSGEGELVQFIEQIKQRNPDFTADQLTAIISGEMDSILQILNGKLQNTGVPVISGKIENQFRLYLCICLTFCYQCHNLKILGEADLLETIQLVLQKYRSKSVPSPSIPQSMPSKLSIVPQQLPLAAVQSGENNLIQSIQKIQQPSGTVPILSGEADLVQFIQEIKTRHPDLSSSQLSAIISGEANSISQILTQKTQQKQQQQKQQPKLQTNVIPIVSGSADLLEAVEFVIQKYRNQSQLYPSPLQNTISYPQLVPLPSQGQV